MSQTLPTEQLVLNLSFHLSEPCLLSNKKGSSVASFRFAEVVTVTLSALPRGVYTAEDKNSRISEREQRSLHAGLLGGMRDSERNEVRFNPNLSPNSVMTRFQRGRIYASRLAQWREDAIVTREIERQISAVALGHVVVQPGGYF